MWSLSEAKLKGHLIGHTSSLSEVIALSNDRLVSCADFADDVRIWDLKRLGLDTPLDEHSDVVVFAHRRGDQLVTGSHDETLRRWDVNSATTLLSIPSSSGPLTGGAWLDPERFIAVTCDLGMTETFDAPTAMACLHLSDGAAQQHFVGHSDWIRGLELIDERRLLSWSDDHDLRLWDLESGRCLQRLTGHEEAVRGGCALDEGTWMSWSEDGTLRCWDLNTGETLKVLRGHDEPITGAAALPVVVSPPGTMQPKPRYDCTLALAGNNERSG